VHKFKFILASFFLNLATTVSAVEMVNVVPDEFESTGGHAVGLANSGVAALADTSAVRANPAMLALERQYTLGIGYHWPTAGRDFYQAGVVDSVTSSLAAGFNYVGFTEKFKGQEELDRRDSPVKQRASLAFAKVVDRLAVGLTGNYVEGYRPKESIAVGSGEDFDDYKGASVGLGLAGLLTTQLRIGASVENLGNRKVENLAPQMIRAGIAYLTFNGSLTLQLDYRERQALENFYADESEGAAPGAMVSLPVERMLFTSFSLKVYDLARLFGSYGNSMSEEARRSYGYGVALAHEIFSISYGVYKPHMDLAETHNAVNVNLAIAM
jgi:hypothetical protein